MDRITSWWIRRSRLEKQLLSSTSALLLFGLAVILTLIVTLPCSSDRDYRNQPSQPSTCVTAGCISIAAEYLRKANLSGDPCNDFYNFACGQYEANTAIAEYATPFTDARTDMNNRLKDILDSPPAGNENKAFGKARSYYNACKNLSEIYILREKPLQALLKQLGGWPAVEGEKWSLEGGLNFEWAETIYAMRRIGVNHNVLVDLSVVIDERNSSTNIIRVDKSTLGVSKPVFFLRGISDTLVQRYLKLMIDTAVLTGADRDSAEPELTAALEFENQLARIMLIEENRPEIKTLGYLQGRAPMLNWVEFANQLLVDKVDENEAIIVVSPNYLKQLTKLLLRTPKRTVANYLMWRVALFMIDMLDDRFRNIWLEYNMAVTGQTGDSPRWLICLTTTKAYFSHALGAMYVRRYFDKYARNLTLNLVRDVKEEFISILSKVDWMDPITLSRTLNKAKVMEEMVAYPLELLNDTALDDYYINISIPENKFFSSVLQMRKIWIDYNYNKLRQIHNRSDWRSKPSVMDINAFNYQSENFIIIPAGILQGILFGSDRPRYINYGAIGTLIGHEITHGFDDQGRKYDAVGNFLKWEQPATDVQFVNKAKCIIDQYSHYMMILVNMTVDGTNTLSENIADNGGVKAAYQAYRKWESNNYVEKSLPGMNFTTRQLFWLSFANVWCAKTTHRSALLTILTDKHSPSIFRVNGVVSNSPEFSTDFKCPIGSPMNPVKKCAVW